MALMYRAAVVPVLRTAIACGTACEPNGGEPKFTALVLNETDACGAVEVVTPDDERVRERWVLAAALANLLEAVGGIYCARKVGGIGVACHVGVAA